MPEHFSRMLIVGTLTISAAFGVTACTTTVSGHGTAASGLPAGSGTTAATDSPARPDPSGSAGAPTAGAPTTTASTGTDRLTACVRIQAALRTVITKAQQQLADLAALARTYRAGGTEIRTDSNQTTDPAVRSAGLKIAAAMDDIGTALANGQVPNTTPMVTAGAELQSACS